MRLFQTLICALAIIASTQFRSTHAQDMALIPAGQYAPLLRDPLDPPVISIESFYLDILPVSNADYLQFVTANPDWSRSHIKTNAASCEYLKAWAGDLDLGPNICSNAPVTFISWHAAKAYARWKGKRLPTTDEWEYAAAASRVRIDGKNDPEFVQEIRRWYSTPALEKLPAMGQKPANFFGVKDLHGLVWEWTADFVLTAMNSDSRGDSPQTSDRICGGGSVGARDRDDFPSFMRYGFRSSLQATYTVHNLGFRCARNLTPESESAP